MSADSRTGLIQWYHQRISYYEDEIFKQRQKLDENLTALTEFRRKLYVIEQGNQ